MTRLVFGDGLCVEGGIAPDANFGVRRALAEVEWAEK
jgi:hypothetical protein